MCLCYKNFFFDADVQQISWSSFLFYVFQPCLIFVGKANNITKNVKHFEGFHSGWLSRNN